MDRPVDHKEGGRHSLLSQILDRESQKWTSSFHESTAESRSVLDTPLYYHGYVSVSSLEAWVEREGGVEPR